MNVYDLDTLSLHYIRRPVDDDGRNELSQYFLVAYNEIYRRIMSKAYPLTKIDTITLDSSKCFSISSLSSPLIGIKYILSEYSAKLLWEKRDEDTIKVRTHSNYADVCYSYMPPLLKNETPTVENTGNDETNIPIIPEEYHNIFSLWAAYRYLHAKRQFEDANYYYEMSMELFSQISSDYSESAYLNINFLN